MSSTHVPTHLRRCVRLMGCVVRRSATISPSEINYEETVSTLRYAASVKKIKTAASANMEWENAGVIEKLKIEVLPRG